MTKLFHVAWSKTYYTSGSVTVEAGSSHEAEEIVRDRMGDYEGSMQHDADRDFVEAASALTIWPPTWSKVRPATGEVN